MVALFINSSALIAVLFSFYQNREKTKKALTIALLKGTGLTPQLLVIISFIGLFFAFIPSEMIHNYLGADFNLMQVLAASIFGSILMIPSLIALPFAGSLLEAGASYTPVAAFITTLTMVGFVTIPVELKELGKKITIYRNLLAFISAVIISFLLGVVM
ncbi:MAG: permease [Bacillota bacterium]